MTRGRRPTARAAAIPNRWRWLKLLVFAAVAWVAAVAALAATRDPYLIPLTVTTGSFAVPVCGAIYIVDRLYDTAIPRVTIVEAFALGGTLGIVLATLGEYLLVGRGVLEYVGVGLIEEAAKLAALWVVARRLGTYSVRNGIVLGVAVGFGFAAFESSGYALVALFGPHGLDLHNMIDTVVARGLLAPVGHGLWTGTLGGALFMAARDARLRLAPHVVGTYALVAVLHALYDSSSRVGALIVGVLTGNARDWRKLLDGRIPTPMTHSLTSIDLWSAAWIVVVSVVGLYAMARVWRRAVAPPLDPIIG